MKSTLDTNLFLYGLTEDPTCQLALRKYINTNESFLTKKVNDELASKKGEWALLLGMLIHKWDGKQELSKTFEEIKQFFSDESGELMNCENLIQYLENKRKNSKNFNLEQERTRLLSYLGGFLTNRKPVYPSEEMFLKYKQEYDDIRKKMNTFNLVDGEQDKRIIQQVYLVAIYFSDNITLVTANIKDFHTERVEWNTHMKNILVIHPKAF